MLRGLQIANILLFLIGLTFVTTLSVVAVMLAFWVGEYPRYRDTLSAVLQVVMLAGMVMGAGALCAWSQYRRWFLWPAFVALGWGLAAVSLFVVARLMGL